MGSNERDRKGEIEIKRERERERERGRERCHREALHLVSGQVTIIMVSLAIFLAHNLEYCVAQTLRLHVF